MSGLDQVPDNLIGRLLPVDGQQVEQFRVDGQVDLAGCGEILELFLLTEEHERCLALDEGLHRHLVPLGTPFRADVGDTTDDDAIDHPVVQVAQEIEVTVVEIVVITIEDHLVTFPARSYLDTVHEGGINRVGDGGDQHRDRLGLLGLEPRATMLRRYPRASTLAARSLVALTVLSLVPATR